MIESTEIGGAVIYEKPELTFKQYLKEFWQYVIIYSEGFTKQFKEKKELERNMEGKDNGKQIRTGLPESKEVLKENS